MYLTLLAIVAGASFVIIAVASIATALINWYYARRIVQVRAEAAVYAQLASEYEWIARLYTRKSPQVLRGGRNKDKSPGG